MSDKEFKYIQFVQESSMILGYKHIDMLRNNVSQSP